MKKYILNNLKLLVLGILIAVGTSYVFVSAKAWVTPPSNPPASDALSPIDVSQLSQTKSGDLSVWSFTANKNAAFSKYVFFDYDPTNKFYGFWRGGSVDSPDSKVVTIGNTTPITLQTTGKLAVAKDASFNNLANNSKSRICGDKDGNVVLCAPGPGIDFCLNNDEYPGIQSSVPVGSWRYADGTCQHAPDECKNIYGNQASIPNGFTRDASGNCYLNTAITATPLISRSCDAERPDTGGLFDSLAYYTVGQLPGWDAGQHGNQVTGGTFDLTIAFNKALPEDMKFSFKVCVDQPDSYEQWFGTKTYYHSYATCELNTVDQFLGLTESGKPITEPISTSPYYKVVGGAFDAARYASMLGDSDTKTYNFTVAKGATSVTIPHLYCTRAGKGSDLKFAAINPNAWGVAFSDAGTNPQYNTTITFNKPSDYLCTSSKNDPDHCPRISRDK